MEFTNRKKGNANPSIRTLERLANAFSKFFTFKIRIID